MDKANGKPLGPAGVYREMFKAQPQLSRLLALQSLVLMLGRGCVALAAWAVAWAVDSTLASQGAERAALTGAAAIGALYAGIKALEWALSCLHSRLHAAWVLPCAFGFCDKAMAAALEGPLDRGADPAELAKRLDKKAEARAALGFLFHHIAPPIFELCLCAATLAWMGFGWLGWALIPAAAAHVWLAVSLSPKIKARVAQALRGAEKSQSMVAQATESAALARAYGSQSVLSEMMERRSEQERSSFKSQALASDAALSAQSLALAIYGAAFFWAGLSMASSGQVSAGAFAAWVGVSAALFGQLKTLAFAFDGILSSTGGLESLAQALRSSPEREAFRATGAQPPGELALHGWSVSVGGQGILAIDQLRLGAGEKLYLVGASGAGKTSLALSLLGQRESSGAMSWAGKPWEPGRPGACAHVPQDRSVIAGSARDNLRLGDPAACDERMWAALRQAKLAETIEALGGLDAEISWRGSSLSGGQAQRLALARALLSGMPLLLLDEPTSGLDAIAESQILAEISALKDRSAIVCAHRIRAIPKGSRVALLSGRLDRGARRS